MPRVAILAFAAVTMVLAPSAGFAQATLTAERTGVSASASVLPEDTFLHVSVPDADEFVERFTSTNGAGLYTGDETAALREKFLGFWQQANAMAEGQLGVTADEILGNASGELTLAVTQAPGTPLSLVIMIGFENESVVDSLIEKTEEAYQSQGGEISREATGGVEITTAAIPNGDVDPEAFSLNYFVADNKWVIGSNRGILEELVGRWDGSASRSLATNEIYADMLEKVELGQGRAPAIIAFFDPINLLTEVVNTVSEVNPQVGMQAGMALGMLPLTGLEGLLGVMSATDFDTEEGYDAVSKQYIYIEQPKQGLLNVFNLKTQDQSPPNWIPAEVGAYNSLTWDVDTAYKAVEKFVDNLTGQPGKTAGFLDQIRDMPGSPGLHIKEDILDQLEGTIRTVSTPGETDALEDIGGRQMFAFGLNRTHNMSEVLEKIVDAAEGELETRDFRGTTIYEMEIPAQSLDGAGSKVAGLAITQENLVFATDVTLLEEVIRGNSGDALVDNSLFEYATDGFPAETATLSFTNVATSVKPIYSFATSEIAEQLLGENDETAWVVMLLEDLPEFSDIEKYFGVVAGYSVGDGDGLLTVQRFLPPAE